MNRRITLTITLFILIISAYSQQEPQYSQYMMHPFSFNPGAAGINDGFCANSFVRKQWMGFDGAPTTILLSLDGAIPVIHGGAGLQILQDKIGPFTDTDIKLAYAYHYNLGPGKLSAGLQLGLFNKSTNFGDLHPIEGGNLGDGSKESKGGFDIAFGGFYNIKNKLYAGVSLSQILASNENFSKNKYDYKLARHFYLTGGYHIALDNMGLNGIVITPSTLIKTDGVSWQFDLSVLGEYNNKMWAGVSYRYTDAVVIMLGLKPFGPGPLENLKAGFAYDVTTSSMGYDGKGSSSGSIEVYLGYCFKLEIKKEPASYKNVRFL